MLCIQSVHSNTAFSEQVVVGRAVAVVVVLFFSE